MKEHIGSYVHVPCCVSVNGHTQGSGGFCNCDLNQVFGELHEFGRMQSCFSVWMCFILGEGRALNGIHDIYIYIYNAYRIHYIYIYNVYDAHYKTLYTRIPPTSWRMHIEGNLTTRRWRAVLIAVLAFLIVRRKYRRPAQFVKAQPWQYNRSIGVVVPLVPKCGWSLNSVLIFGFT